MFTLVNVLWTYSALSLEAERSLFDCLSKAWLRSENASMIVFLWVTD